jgi:N-acetylmuramic acid 6-phosphate etherase
MRDKDGYLGIEAGGTRTAAILVDAKGNLLQRNEFGPANIRLISDKVLFQRFREIALAFPNVRGIGIGMAGAREAKDRERIEQAVSKIWGAVPRKITHDLEIALEASETEFRNAKILVLSGTGSCCYGRATSGKTAKLGGWGHILGDKGSGYEIGLRALKAIVYYYDRDAHWGELGQKILRHLCLNEPNQLIDWVSTAEKSKIAAVALEVFAAAGKKDEIARDILKGAAHSLARDAVSCAARLVTKRQKVSFILAGSVLTKQPTFAKQVGALIKQAWTGSEVSTLERDGVWGAVKMAMAAKESEHLGASRKSSPIKQQFYVPEFDPQKARTEQRNPRSKNLHKLSLSAGVKLMLKEEAKVAPALFAEQKKITCAVSLVASALQKGGRLFYVGAGTSGRLGVLDASECPPTFRADPEMIQGIIAGGQQALWRAVEGAEDDLVAGVDAIAFRGVTARDVVVGIAASGRTPFVWGAIAEARRRGAKTILLCFNPALEIKPEMSPDLVIAPDLGPEVLTGSTRLKSGTATKLILNAISTLAMVRLGKVISNLMVDLNPSNVKLRDRAVRIIQELTGRNGQEAEQALKDNGWVVKKAWQDLQRRRLARSS